MPAPRLLLFDLDDTLLTSQKTLSPRTLRALDAARRRGVLIGICTSRSEVSCVSFLPDLRPDALITSGGALVKAGEGIAWAAEFSPEDVRAMIALIRQICGIDVSITADTRGAHYRNYPRDPRLDDQSWGETVLCDFAAFDKPTLKLCAEIFDPAHAETLKRLLPGCDCLRFSGSCWYKFTRREATKEGAILRLCDALGIAPADITAFGDDIPDIGMLKLCGTGVAMGNALPEVKRAADLTIAGNDEDGIARYLEDAVL